jgi:SPP1 gp7 family putative phage head morphogenesis protein
MGVLGITDKIGRFIPAKVRAEMIARTEIIRALHLAAVEEYRQWGVKGIVVMAEWRTAHDAKVCAKCASMEGQVFTLDEIEYKIPAHPDCRCFILPIMR